MTALPEHLRTASVARTEQAASKARAALKQLTAARQPINFAAVARVADVSTDFLYRHNDLRAQIERHRTKSSHFGQRPAEPEPAASTASSAVRALTRKLEDERSAHRETTAQLRRALEVAQGENLELRRRLTAYEPD